jgi:predicted dehydrogenase
MNACIIGCGSIGALKPDEFDSPSSKNILTHAHALYQLKNKDLIKNIFLIDSNYLKLKEAKQKWSCQGFTTLESLHTYSNEKIDLFVISAPTNYHYDILLDLYKVYTPKLVIVEKPFTSNLDQAQKIKKLYSSKNIPIVINYTRRFCPTIQTLKQEFDSNKYGKIKACNIIYVRGFQRDACHAIDLCNYFFGDFISGKILGHKDNAYDDYCKEDLTYPVWMEYTGCKNIYFTPADGRDYSIFEMDILTENSRINIIDHGKQIKIFNKTPEKIYGKFNGMNYEVNEIINNELENALYFMHGNCLNYLQSKNKKKYDLFCTIDDGIKVQKIYNKVLG